MQGTTQLLSVPYALYSEKTRLLAGNSTINITNGNTITGNYQAGTGIGISGNVITNTGTNYQAANNTILLTGNTIAGNYQAANNTISLIGNTIAGNYQAANNTISLTGNTIAGNYQAANYTILLAGNTIAGNYQAANNTISLTGNSIAGNYQAANNTISLTGNAIAGNYQAANNTILLAGNTIAGNYQAGTGINLTGNTISHNLVAGTGINISGNVITNTGSGSSLWIPDASGIHNQSGNVGIRTNSTTASALTVSQENTNGATSAMDIFSGDTWQTATRFRNTTVNHEYQFNLAGSANIDQTPGSFGIFHTATLNWLWHCNPANDYLGIGSYIYKPPLPKSRLHVFNGDVNIDQIGSGVIIKSPNGSCWRVTVSNTGTLVTTAITCPN